MWGCVAEGQPGSRSLGQEKAANHRCAAPVSSLEWPAFPSSTTKDVRGIAQIFQLIL